MSESARSVLKHLYKEGRMTEEQYRKIDRNMEVRLYGTWIDHSDEGYVECPFCDHATTCDDNIEELHYCFFCGAELRKEGEAE